MPQRTTTPGERPGTVARLTRSGPAVSATLVICVAALIAAVPGSASACAAPHTIACVAPQRAVASAGLTWHKLTLLNGWGSSGSMGTGDPSWAVQGGVVYLSGSLHQNSGNIVEFAVLPKAARPARLAEVPVYTFDGTVGRLEIYPTGNIYAKASAPDDVQAYTSLAGVSFPAAGVRQQKLSLINGWKRGNGFWDGPPSYRVSGGMIYLSGALRQPSGSKDEFAVLPKAARPSHVEYITVATPFASTAVLKIYPDGAMFAYGGHARKETWLGGVSFPQATTTSRQLTLINGWTSGQGKYKSGAPSYWVSGGVVHLSGSLIQQTVSNEAFAFLPRDVRPAHSLYIKVYAFGGAVGTLYIQPGGLMEAYSQVTSDATSYTSLAAVSFPITS